MYIPSWPVNEWFYFASSSWYQRNTVKVEIFVNFVSGHKNAKMKTHKQLFAITIISSRENFYSTRESKFHPLLAIWYTEEVKNSF